MNAGFCLLFLLTLQMEPPEGQAPYARGVQYFQEGQFDRAEAEFLEAIRKSPNLPEPWLFLGKIQFARRSYVEAEEMFSRAIQLSPRFAEAYHALGVLYLQQKVYARAEELLLKSISLKADSPLFYLDLGAVYLNQGRLEDARGIFDRLLRQAALDSSVLFAANFNLAMVLRAQGDAETALVHVQRADTLAPNRPDVLLARFELCAQQGLTREAGQALDRLVQMASGRPDLQRYLCLNLLDGKYPSELAQNFESRLAAQSPRFEALVTLGAVFLASGQFQKATEILKEALKIDSSSAIGLFLVGKAYNQLNDRRAIQALIRSIELYPGEERAWKELSDAFAKHKAHQEAIRTFERYAQLFPQNALARVFLGEAYFGGSLVWKAIAEFEKAVKLNPDLFSANYALGFVYKYVGNHEQARIFLKRALSLEPSDGLANLDLGEILIREGDYDSATTYLKKAALTGSASAHFRLGQVYLLEKKHSQAELELKKSIELDPRNPQPHYLLAQVYFASSRTELAKSEYALFRELEKGERQSQDSKTDAHFKD